MVNGKRSYGNLLASIPQDLTAEVFEILAQTDAIKIERIISKGHTSPDVGWHDQDQNEWVVVLKGSAVLDFADGQTLDLQAGSYVNIPAHTKHRVTWTTDDTETVWLAIHY